MWSGSEFCGHFTQRKDPYFSHQNERAKPDKMIGSASLYSLITQIIRRARSYKEESLLNDNGDNHKILESNLKEVDRLFLFCFFCFRLSLRFFFRLWSAYLWWWSLKSKFFSIVNSVALTPHLWWSLSTGALTQHPLPLELYYYYRNLSQ